jgi:agmatine deiminase
VNRAGQEESCRFFGGSFICDAFGKIMAKAGDGEETVIVSLDLSMNKTVQESWGFFRNRRPDTYGRIGIDFPGEISTFPTLREGDTPRNRGFHMPAEWHNNTTFPHLSAVEEAYFEFIRAVHTFERVELFVPTAVIHRKVRARLREAGVDLSLVTLHTSDYSDVWIRDYGPTFLVNRTLQKTAIVHWDFNAWGGKYEDQIRDGRIPLTMNRRLSLPIFTPGIVLEGGSIDVNGKGTVLTTRACLLNPNRNPILSADQIEEQLKEYLGVEKVIYYRRRYRRAYR